MALSVLTAGNRGIAASVLKNSELSGRASLRVQFRSPNDLRTILLDLINNRNSQPYEDLVYFITFSDIQDEDLYLLLHNARECISLMDQTMHHFVDAILKLKWAHRSDKTAKEFQGFLLDLLSAHIYYTKNALDVLVANFNSGENSIWKDGVPSENTKYRYDNVHSVLCVLLQVIPMSCDLLRQAVGGKFPYLRRSPQEHESYIYNMLKIIEYQPHLRVEFLIIIVNKLILLDVNAPRSEIEDAEDDASPETIDSEMFEMDESEEAVDSGLGKSGVSQLKHPVARNLDISLDCVFRFFFSECHDNGDKAQLNWERTKRLFEDMLTVFNTLILPTHAAHHVQFLMFYLCSFKVTLAEMFINLLWRKVSCVSVPSVIRQTAVLYIASFLARATFISISTLKNVIAEMSSWIDNYIANQDGLACANSDIRVHSVFYSVCQALLYTIAFRHRDLVNTKTNLMFLQGLNLTKIVTCRLNPLKVCLPAIVQNFATVTRTYQLAYCYTVMEHNARNTMPTLRRDDVGMNEGSVSREQLNTFFPFDPFVLLRSGRVISPIYREYQGSVNVEEQNISKPTPIQREDDDDDFLTDHSADYSMSSPVLNPPDFSYGTSPGFKHL